VRSLTGNWLKSLVNLCIGHQKIGDLAVQYQEIPSTINLCAYYIGVGGREELIKSADKTADEEAQHGMLGQRKPGVMF
jgi:hypothetical protein